MKTHGDATGAVLFGLESFPVTVHAEAFGEQPAGLRIVGLSDAAERETSVRVRSALATVGAGAGDGVTVTLGEFPRGCSTSPLDLPIAVAVLRALGKVPPQDGARLIGELALDGALHAVRGVIAHLWRRDVERVIVPLANEREAVIAAMPGVRGAATLAQAIRVLGREESGLLLGRPAAKATADRADLDFADVADPRVRRALEIAAAGGHGILLVGSPGAGKTMAARRLSAILPEMTRGEELDVTRNASVAGLLNGAGLVTSRPFRAPHHTVSDVGLLGGGASLRPGEVTLAQHGVLFLDELPEFRVATLAALASAMRAGEVRFRGGKHAASLPCAPLLVAAANRCPCGYLGSPSLRCQCDAARIERHWARFDEWAKTHTSIRVEMTQERTLGGDRGESTATVRERVTAARRRQYHRNGALNERQDHDPVYRAARTIADLDGGTAVEARHMEEAQSFVEPKS